jgi:hypothetical protein
MIFIQSSMKSSFEYISYEILWDFVVLKMPDDRTEILELFGN